VTSEDTVIRFFAAIEAGDVDTVRAIYGRRSALPGRR
jgi:hypothetical protein